MIKTRSIRILAAVLLVAGFTVPVTHANNQLTVADGTDLSYSSPINFVWVDTQGIRTQVLYPAEELSDMRDEPINSVTFYISGGCGTSGGRLRVSVGETEQTSLGPYVSALTQVATISLTQGVTELTINFDNPYLYHGSNLVI